MAKCAVSLCLLLLARCDAFMLPGAPRAVSFARCAVQPSMGAGVRQVLSRSGVYSGCTNSFTPCGNIAQVNTAEFEEAIQDCSTPIIVDIYAVWCARPAP